jgi:hypothetical protein
MRSEVLLVVGVGDGYGRGGKARIYVYWNILTVAVSERYLER